MDSLAAFIGSTIRRTALENAESKIGQVTAANADGTYDVLLTGGGTFSSVQTTVNTGWQVDMWVTMERSGGNWQIVGPAAFSGGATETI